MVDQLHLLRRSIHLHAVDLQFIICQVDGKLIIFDLFHGLALVLPCAAQHRLDPGHYLLGLKGLHNVIVGSQFQAQHLVKHLALGGKHNNRHLRFFPDFTADLPAVQLGQHNIQQNQFRVLFFIELHSLLAVIGDHHLIAFLFQIKAE